MRGNIPYEKKKGLTLKGEIVGNRPTIPLP